MWKINVQLRSVRDVQDFVSLTTAFPFPVRVGNDQYHANGKSFMEMFCLDFSRPLIAVADCSREEFAAFVDAICRFLA